jgi:hypothetical protein
MYLIEFWPSAPVGEQSDMNGLARVGCNSDDVSASGMCTVS